jgi:hypothetical protein
MTITFQIKTLIDHFYDHYINTGIPTEDEHLQ